MRRFLTSSMAAVFAVLLLLLAKQGVSGDRTRHAMPNEHGVDVPRPTSLDDITLENKGERRVRDRPERPPQPDDSLRTAVKNMAGDAPLVGAGGAEWLDDSHSAIAIGVRNAAGEKEGLWRAYLLDGSPWTETDYKNDLPDGFLRVWGPDGALRSEAQYKSGKLNGTSTHWYSTGAIAMELAFVDGKQHGTSREWYHNGQLKSELEYNRGVLWGECRYFADTGVLKQELSGIYENGKRIASLGF